MKHGNLLKDNKGMAMVLSISLIGLLSLLGVWMLLQSDSTSRITKSTTRHQSAFQLADGSLQKAKYSLRKATPRPDRRNHELRNSDAPAQIPSDSGQTYMTPTTVGSGTTNPELRYVTYDTVLPPGWAINDSGSYTKMIRIYYEPRGSGTISSSQGTVTSVVYAFIMKLAHM